MLTGTGVMTVELGKLKGFRVDSESELTRLTEESDVEDEKMRGAKPN